MILATDNFSKSFHTYYLASLSLQPSEASKVGVNIPIW